MLIKTCMSPISQQEQAQCVKRKVGEAGINQLSLAVDDMNLPCHGASLLATNATKGSMYEWTTYCRSW
jgi:hypothetical protein